MSEHLDYWQAGYTAGRQDERNTWYFNPWLPQLGALRAMKSSWTWRGVRMCLAKTYPPRHTGNRSKGWVNLLFRPGRVKRHALGDGMGT